MRTGGVDASPEVALKVASGVAVAVTPTLAQSCASAWYAADLSESSQEEELMQLLTEEMPLPHKQLNSALLQPESAVRQLDMQDGTPESAPLATPLGGPPWPPKGA